MMTTSTNKGSLGIMAFAFSSVSILAATGCSRSPTFSILGSFFPAWILCGVLGLLLTTGIRLLFVRLRFEQEMSPLVLIYPCFAAFFTFSIWLLFFS
jgi:hypothetical protein